LANNPTFKNLNVARVNKLVIKHIKLAPIIMALENCMDLGSSAYKESIRINPAIFPLNKLRYLMGGF
jgi:hypothetical protein